MLVLANCCIPIPLFTNILFNNLFKEHANMDVKLTGFLFLAPSPPPFFLGGSGGGKSTIIPSMAKFLGLVIQNICKRSNWRTME